MKHFILSLAFFLATPSAQAMLLLEIEGKIVSFTEEWVSIDQGRVRYTINRSKLRPEDSEKIKTVNSTVSFAIDPDSVIEARTVK
jgi:hypothetical protein